jgi:GNAT superfamily N-acetyltransferase
VALVFAQLEIKGHRGPPFMVKRIEISMDVHIRKAGNEDVPALAEFLKSLELFPRIQAEALEVIRDQVSRHLRQNMADNSHSVYVAQNKEDEILGYCAVHWLPYLMLPGPEGYVSELFLRESSRGLGIGGRLLKTVRAEAEKRGCSRLMLLNLRNRESYQRGFYKKQGWTERQEAVNFIMKIEEVS